MTQWLRLKSVSALATDESEREGPNALRERLQAGETLEIAGYAFNPALASAIDAAKLDFATSISTAVWREVSSASPPAMGASGASVVEALTSRGVIVDAAVVAGPPFWQTVEIEMCDALVASTIEAMLRNAGSANARDSASL
jgi:hypothetical protein